MSGCLLTITKDCPLGKVGETLLFPIDKIMFPATLLHSGWQLEELEFLDRTLDRTRSYSVLDIGANVGLFSRQVALRFPNATQFCCVEADPLNFKALQYNLSHLQAGACTLWNIALSDRDEARTFMRDLDNIGNYSLNLDAMRGREFSAINVECRATDKWMRNSVDIRGDSGLIWKSDTQGYDELIVSLTPSEIWAKVEVAIIELWCIEKPDFDVDAFRSRIEAFPNMSIGGKDRHSSADVLSFIAGRDFHHEDLYLWR